MVFAYEQSKLEAFRTVDVGGGRWGRAWDNGIVVSRTTGVLLMSKRFNPPPNWPPAPDGWAPPAGWRPDPAWGPAPAGWNFWVEDIDVDATLLPSASSPSDSSDSPYAPDSSQAPDDTRFPDDSNSSVNSPAAGGSLSAGDSDESDRSSNSADETISRLPRRSSRRRNGSGAHAAPPESLSSQQQTPDRSDQANAAPGPAFRAGAAPESSRPRFAPASSAPAGSAGGGQPFVPGGRNVPAGGQGPSESSSAPSAFSTPSAYSASSSEPPAPGSRQTESGGAQPTSASGQAGFGSEQPPGQSAFRPGRPPFHSGPAGLGSGQPIPGGGQSEPRSAQSAPGVGRAVPGSAQSAPGAGQAAPARPPFGAHAPGLSQAGPAPSASSSSSAQSVGYQPTERYSFANQPGFQQPGSSGQPDFRDSSGQPGFPPSASSAPSGFAGPGSSGQPRFQGPSSQQGLEGSSGRSGFTPLAGPQTGFAAQAGIGQPAEPGTPAPESQVAGGELPGSGVDYSAHGQGLSQPTYGASSDFGTGMPFGLDGTPRKSFLTSKAGLAVLSVVAVIAIAAAIIFVPKLMKDDKDDGPTAKSSPSTSATTSPRSKSPDPDEPTDDESTPASTVAPSKPTRPALTGTFKEYQGDGPQTIDIQKPQGSQPVLLYFEINPASNYGFFLVEAQDAGGSQTERFGGVVKDEKTTGTFPLDAFANGKQTAKIRVTAPGPWMIRVYPISSIPTVSKGATIAGNSYEAFLYRGGEASATFKYVGNTSKGRVTGTLWPTDGSSKANSFIKEQKAAVEKDVTIPAKTGESLILIDNTGGNWSLEIP